MCVLLSIGLSGEPWERGFKSVSELYHAVSHQEVTTPNFYLFGKEEN